MGCSIASENPGFRDKDYNPILTCFSCLLSEPVKLDQNPFWQLHIKDIWNHNGLKRKTKKPESPQHDTDPIY